MFRIRTATDSSENVVRVPESVSYLLYRYLTLLILPPICISSGAAKTGAPSATERPDHAGEQETAGLAKHTNLSSV